MPPTAPSHSIDIMTMKTDLGQFPFTVVSIEIFCQQLIWTRCPWPAIFCHPPPSINSKHHTLHRALLWHGNSITTKRRWLFDQSSGEFSIFLFAKLYIWKFFYNLTAAIFHDSPWPWIPIHDLPSSINLIAKKEAGTHIDHSSAASYSFFIGPII